MNDFKRFLVDAMVQNLFASEPVEEEKVEQMLERIAKKILADDEKHLKLNKSIVCGMLFDKKKIELQHTCTFICKMMTKFFLKQSNLH